jgi:alpha-tubulin suppressor-like RCC1 family protein
VGTDTDWSSIAEEGSYHTHVLKTDGTLWAWGSNGVGELGDGTTTERHTPVQIGTDADWVSVAAGTFYTLALKTDGTLLSWGGNSSGQLGDGTTPWQYSPIRIGTDADWASIAAGQNHTIALKSGGTLWAWGDNRYGQLGDGTTVDIYSPTKIGAANNWASISTGFFHTLALKTDDTLWAWGWNNSGQLGDGTTIERHSPFQIGTDTDWASIAAGNRHTAALKINGTLWAWGWNIYGQLGDATTILRLSPIQIGTDTDWASIAVGGDHTIALKTNGTLWAWGKNWHGQLGDGTTTQRLSPVQMSTDTDWTSITAGRDHTIALITDGTLWAWGGNDYGQLGDATTTLRLSPIQIGTDSDWAYIAAGGYHTNALKTDGTLWAWGNNWSGQLGDSTTTARYSPTQIGADTDWVSIGVGEELHTLALKTDGTLWGWGGNGSGQLGDGTISYRTTLFEIMTLSCTDSDHDGYAIDGGACGSVDCDDGDDNERPGQTWYADLDGDLYSDGSVSITCERPAGYKISSELTATSGDCDDNNPAIYPGITRPTNCGIGACAATGTETCIDGSWGGNTCTPGTPAANDSVCNGLDDDCNGLTDEDYTATPTACGQGVCAATGQLKCQNGAEVNTCTPGPPSESSDVTCDGLDGDCDGQVDEDASCAATTYSIEFEMTGCGPGPCTDTYDTWLPEDGKTASLTVRVKDNLGNDVDTTIALSYTISNKTGKYTNDASGITTNDFDTPAESAASTGYGKQIGLISRDYGGKIEIRAQAYPTTDDHLDVTFKLPKDTDGDGVPDNYEKDHSGSITGLNAGDNNETHTGGTATGDGLTVLEEYRGVKWGAKMVKLNTAESSFTCVDTAGPLGTGSCANPYQTDAYLPEANPAGHYRLSPVKKDLFIKFEFYDYVSYDSTTTTHTFTREYKQTGCAGVPALATATIFDNCTFALGSVFSDEIGLDVYVYGLTASDVGDIPVVGENNIDAAVVKNAFSQAADARDNHIFPRPPGYNPRDWSWSIKGQTNNAGDPAVIYSDVKTFQYALDNYFNENPYVDGGHHIAPNGKLESIADVEDINDDGVFTLSGNPSRQDNDIDGDGVMDGDHLFRAKDGNQYLCKTYVCNYQLNTFDIDWDGMIEHAVQGDPDNIPVGVENTKAQSLKHTLSHEVGHAIGIGYGMANQGHTTDGTCLMNEPSNNWRRDDHFSTIDRNVKSEIYIHND